MIALSGELGKDLCDRHLPMSRRDVLKVGGSSMLGLSLGAMLQMKANASPLNLEDLVGGRQKVSL